MSELTCYVCENETEAGDSFKCGGVCTRRMHGKCVGMNKTVLKAYMEMDNLFYMCDVCINNSMKAINNKLDKIMSVITIYDERVVRYEEDMMELKECVSELKVCVKMNKVDEESPINVNTQSDNSSKKPTFADKVKQNDPVVLVVPKQNQTAQVTQKAVMELMDPTEIPIENMRNAAKGTIVLEGRNREDLNTIQKYAAEKLGNTYEVKPSELRKPKILISGICEKLTAEEIVTKLKRQNESMEYTDLNVVSIFGKNTFNAVIEIDCEGFNKIMSNKRKKLNVGWSSCLVKEYVNVLSCYKCKGFNHKAKDCKKDRSCKKCASPRWSNAQIAVRQIKS